MKKTRRLVLAQKFETARINFAWYQIANAKVIATFERNTEASYGELSGMIDKV